LTLTIARLAPHWQQRDATANERTFPWATFFANGEIGDACESPRGAIDPTI